MYTEENPKGTLMDPDRVISVHNLSALAPSKNNPMSAFNEPRFRLVTRRQCTIVVGSGCYEGAGSG